MLETIIKSGIKERITMIAKKPKMTIYMLIAVLLVTIAAVGCTFTGAVGESGIIPLSDAEIERTKVLLSRIPEENIELYGVKIGENPEDYTDFILSINGTSREYNWYNINNESFLPTLEMAGLNGDGQKELLVILTESEGTGVNMQKIHVINSPNFNEILVDDPLTFTRGNEISTSIVKENGFVTITLSVGGKTYKKTYEEGDSQGWADDIITGNIIKYEVAGGKLTATVPVQVSNSEFIGVITITYAFDGTKYTMGAVSYAPYIGNIDRGSGNIERIAQADLNQDGKDEYIYIDRSQIEAFLVTLLVKDSSGNDIWSETLSSSHVGWDQIFLTELDGKQYLLRYNPGMFQGICQYTYTVFSPEKGGKENVIQSNTLEFDVNGSKELDAAKMVAFADEVNSVLKKSTLLISSDGGAWSFGPVSAEPFFERYSWLDDNPELYEAGDNLGTRLNKYSDFALYNRKLSDVATKAYHSIGPSDKFSEAEIRGAMDRAIAKFRDFEGCELTKLWYDEEKSNAQIKSYMTGGHGSVNGVSKDNVIVLYSDFTVDSSGGDGSLNPNSTYSDWMWILIRDSGKSEWRVDDWGY
jgi:hypothetical protein